MTVMLAMLHYWAIGTVHGSFQAISHHSNKLACTQFGHIQTIVQKFSHHVHIHPIDQSASRTRAGMQVSQVAKCEKISTHR